MRKFSGAEMTVLLMGLVSVWVGGGLLAFPKAYVRRIPANTKYSDASYVEKVSKDGCRVYGALSVVFGVGLSAAAVLPLKPDRF